MAKKNVTKKEVKNESAEVKKRNSEKDAKKKKCGCGCSC